MINIRTWVWKPIEDLTPASRPETFNVFMHVIIIAITWLCTSHSPSTATPWVETAWSAVPWSADVVTVETGGRDWVPPADEHVDSKRFDLKYQYQFSQR